MPERKKWSQTMKHAESIAAQTGETLDQYIVRLYTDDQSGVKIAEATGISSFTVYRRLSQLGVDRRRRAGRPAGYKIPEDSPTRTRMSEAGIKAWTGPNRELRVRQLHAGDSDQKRSDSLHEWYQKNPDDAARKTESTVKTRVEKREHKLKGLLGADYAGNLRYLYLDRGFTVAQIADMLSQPVGVVGNWIVQLGISGGKGKGSGANTPKKENTAIAQKAQAAGLIETLNMDQWTVICLRYLSHAGVALCSIAEMMGVTKQRINQKEQAGLMQLQRKLARKQNNLSSV